MSNRKTTFLLKGSNIPGKVPVSGDLQLKEIAINFADVILYASGTTANSILPIGWDRISRTGDTMTGNLVINGDINISGYTLSENFSATTISSTTITLNDVTFNKLLKEKTGMASGSTFSGNPKKKTIIFENNFPNTNYIILITGANNRTYTYESQSVSGFTINANANGIFTGNVYWLAKEIGEV